MRALLTICALSLVTPTFAQAPPVSPYPIPGRIVRFGYDLAYPTVSGDLISITGSGGAQNNGILMGLPSLDAQYDCAAGVWRAKVYAAGRWAQTVWGGLHVGYYPTDNFAHTWLTPECQPTPEDTINLAPAGTPCVTIAGQCATGVLRCHGVDGVLAVPGDLQPGTNNGVLFSLWAKNAHIIKSAKVYHLSVFLGSNGWHEAVSSKDLCDYDPAG